MTTNNEKIIDKAELAKEPLIKEEDRMTESQADTKKANRFILLIYFVLVVLGVGTGYLINKNMSKGSVEDKTVTVKTVNTDKTKGVNDTTAFKDSAEGVVEKGGIQGEGTHKLIRDGGPSQTVALVSSVLDLDEYIDKKVTVWGQTFPPQKAGWFMDVGKIELHDQQ